MNQRQLAHSSTVVEAMDWSGEQCAPLDPSPLAALRRAFVGMDRTALVMAAMWLFIAAVSAMDVYFSIKYEYALTAEEMNPIGPWLMRLDGGSVGLFMACKFFGNLVALGALQLLYFHYRRVCLVATAVLCAAQCVLAALLLSHTVDVLLGLAP